MFRTTSPFLWLLAGLLIMVLTTGFWAFVLYPIVIVTVVVFRGVRDRRQHRQYPHQNQPITSSWVNPKEINQYERTTQSTYGNRPADC